MGVKNGAKEVVTIVCHRIRQTVARQKYLIMKHFVILPSCEDLNKVNSSLIAAPATYEQKFNELSYILRSLLQDKRGAKNMVQDFGEKYGELVDEMSPTIQDNRVIGVTVRGITYIEEMLGLYGISRTRLGTVKSLLEGKRRKISLYHMFNERHRASIRVAAKRDPMIDGIIRCVAEFLDEQHDIILSFKPALLLDPIIESTVKSAETFLAFIGFFKLDDLEAIAVNEAVEAYSCVISLGKSYNREVQRLEELAAQIEEVHSARLESE